MLRSNMYVSFCCLLGLAINAVADQKKDARTRFIEAPIFYEDLTLILADKKGNVSAVRFPKEIVNGVHYEFRFLADGGKNELQGKAVLSHEWKEIEQGGKSKFVLNTNSMMLRANSIELRWAYRNPGSGWIYYDPEALSVQIGGSAESFKNVDLKRFAKKPTR